MVLKWGNFVIYQTLKHAHADQQRPLKLFTHGFRDSTIETETTYFVPGEFFGLLLNFVVGEKHLQIIHQPAWMERYQGQHDVLLLDWSRLAFFDQNSNGRAEASLPKSNFTQDTKKVLGNNLDAVSKTWPGFLDVYKNYKDASHNVIDVGSFVGRCLADLTRFQMMIECDMILGMVILAGS